MKGVSEHSYEHLTRVFGDMCQDGRMARQADRLFVGGDTLDGLYNNLKEVFHRARNCGFTLKPSKVIINPQRLVLFGWIRDRGAGRPTNPTLTPLVRAELPKTVKQLRGFLGAFKQLSQCIKNYAVILSPLEKLCAGKGSLEQIVWTDILIKQFEQAKSSVNSIQTFDIPILNDVLHTFSDWSQSDEQ